MVGEVAGDRPRARASGPGEKIPCRRPGSASPTTVITAAAEVGRTTATGWVGVGTNRLGVSIEERNVPQAPLARIAVPPARVTSVIDPVPVTSTPTSSRSSRQSIMISFRCQIELGSSMINRQPSLVRVTPGRVSSGPSVRSTEASSDSAVQAVPAASANWARGRCRSTRSR